MSILETYILHANAKNADKIADLFADECYFNDGAAKPFGMDTMIASGKRAVFELFSSIFASFEVVKAEIVKLNPNSMEYDVKLGDMSIPCVGAVSCDNE